MNQKNEYHQDLELSKEDFREIVEFFYDLQVMVIQTEMKIEMRHKSVRILQGKVQKLRVQRQNELQNELEALEKLTKKF